MGPVLLAALLLAGPVAAPPRSGAEQTQLTALAEALGRAHALHRLCTGPTDDLWRSRMGRMMETERPELALRQRLTDGFNAGFADGSKSFPACSPQSRGALQDAELAAARQARALANPSSGGRM
ncbi:hypothetical protein BH09PSE2_BH09PSE2_22760 [soil metagenome]